MTRASLHLAALLVSPLVLIAPAVAQEFVPPRFEALEQQLRTLDQREYDRLESERQAARNSALFPAPGETQAGAALRRLETESRVDRFVLQYEQDRALDARQRTLADAGIPLRRIAPSSILVVEDPKPYGLPPAPKGQYYARLAGRFVLVDATSELVATVLGPAPAEPRGDLPLPLRPPLDQPIPRDR